MSNYKEAIQHMKVGGIASYFGHEYRLNNGAIEQKAFSGIWNAYTPHDTMMRSDKWRIVEIMPTSLPPLIAAKMPDTAATVVKPPIGNITDCMLDLETFGTRPGCAIRSIGASFFNLDGAFGDTFYRNITKDSCLNIGLVSDPQTEAWWAKQNVVAQSNLLVDQLPVAQAVGEFIEWFKKNMGRRVWCQGANFDAPLLEAVIEKLGLKCPWRYFDVRDTRTVYDVFNFNAKASARAGTYHNALDDALHQIRCVLRAKGIVI